MSVRSGVILPGTPTYPELIVQHRAHYFRAIEAADDAYKADRRVDTSRMEELLESLVAKQLTIIYEKVHGRSPTGRETE